MTYSRAAIPRIRSSSISNSAVRTNTSAKPAESFGSANYRLSTLEPNNIQVQDGQLDDEQWCRLAFALGMPYGDIHRSNLDARKFAQQVGRRPSIGSKQMGELLAPLLTSVGKQHGTVNCRAKAAFNRDCVPEGIPDFEMVDSQNVPLPTPKPAFTFGYSADAFMPRHLELQQGIITNRANEPCDLAKLSEPVPSVLWPFLVVETQDESMLAARNAAAGAAASCNQALLTFSSAVQVPQRLRTHGSRHSSNHAALHRHLQGSSPPATPAVQSFSLAVHGKMASLNAHNSAGGGAPHATAAIRTYRLDDERDVEALATRLESIFVWAENSRLAAIRDLLDDFAVRMRLARGLSGCSSFNNDDGGDRQIEGRREFELAAFGPAETRPGLLRRRSTVIKNALVESLRPKWIKT